LSLTPVAADDCIRLHAIFTLPGVRRYIFDDQIIPLEQTAEIVDKSVALFRERGLGLWVADVRPSIPSPPSAPPFASAPSIGFCGFWFFRDPPDLELLYGIVDSEVGRGYGREIARAMVDYGFDMLNMAIIRASCDVGHTASRKLLDAIGFCLTREARIADLDTAFYEIRKKGTDPFCSG
jgi:ribosomal-protein-alanine N-acetyltransferase